MLDFNDIAPVAGGPVDLNAQRDELKRELLARLPAVLMAPVLSRTPSVSSASSFWAFLRSESMMMLLPRDAPCSSASPASPPTWASRSRSWTICWM